MPLDGSSLGRTVDLDTNVNGNPAIYTPANSANTVALSPASVSIAGGSQPFSILSPFQVVSVCIALEGIFPSRN